MSNLFRNIVTHGLAFFAGRIYEKSKNESTQNWVNYENNIDGKNFKNYVVNLFPKDLNPDDVNFYDLKPAFILYFGLKVIIQSEELEDDEITLPTEQEIMQISNQTIDQLSAMFPRISIDIRDGSRRSFNVVEEAIEILRKNKKNPWAAIPNFVSEQQLALAKWFVDLSLLPKIKLMIDTSTNEDATEIKQYFRDKPSQWLLENRPLPAIQLLSHLSIGIS